MTAETTVFVPQHHGGTRATNVKLTKARGTSMPDTNIRTHAHTHRLPSGERQGQSYSADCLCLKRMEKQIQKQTAQQCACVPLHACMRASTQTGTMEAGRLWLVPLQ